MKRTQFFVKEHAYVPDKLFYGFKINPQNPFYLQRTTGVHVLVPDIEVAQELIDPMDFMLQLAFLQGYDGYH
jgi:hypothetical protein